MQQIDTGCPGNLVSEGGMLTAPGERKAKLIYCLRFFLYQWRTDADQESFPRKNSNW
jgi:hypothetical protein